MPVIDVLDSTMYFEDLGEAAVPAVFLHGNPTSSRLWGNVLPKVDVPGRLLAPDPIGMGNPGKRDIPCLFDDHARYLDAWFEALKLACGRHPHRRVAYSRGTRKSSKKPRRGVGSGQRCS
jgi:haloalkane dehalogenase